jgi:putative PIN family toxin of toxin-antitoxin system
MKLVLDTNIYISSYYFGGNPRKILERIIDGMDELYIAKEILEEIDSVMVRSKFKTAANDVAYFIRMIEEIANLVIIKGYVKNVCRDKDDDKILECGLLGNVNYIITGDNDLLILKTYEHIKIITPNEYMEMI